MKTKESVNSNKFYKTNPRGISLIVLVITIIVIIVLASAVILTLNNNNPISEANKARYESDVANMQAIFTNAVAKVMAQNQSTIEVNAGELNSVKTGESSVEGRVNYTVNNPQDSSNENGTIIFNMGENNATTYYTGRMLPLYEAGETIWYVDSEGIISLKVGEQEYGKGDKVNNLAGEVVEEGEEITQSDNPMLQSWASNAATDFHNEEYRNKITKIKFATNVKVPKKAQSWDVSKDKDGSVMAWVKDDGNEGYILTIAGKSQIIAYPNFNYFLNDFTNVKEIENLELLQDLKYLNFSGCSSLTDLDLSKLDMSKITSINFRNCSSLENINFGNLLGCKVVALAFYGCSNLKNLDLSGIDTSNVANMRQMFYNCKNLESLNLSTFNTSQATEMSDMFYNCQKLTSLDLSSFDTSNVTNMTSMFENCTRLKNLNFDSFSNEKNLGRYEYMFRQCQNLTTTFIIRKSLSFTSQIFNYAAIKSGAQITLNYTEENSAAVDFLIHDGGLNIGNVVKGVQVD